MCGIVAIISNSNPKSALNKIKHRGLDSTKILCAENFSIGFNRLAINDKTVNGTQPFEFGNFIGVFNGEIYNADELRKKFTIETKSNSDTEIILPLFEKLGSSIIHYLDGFYSGIIYDKQSEQIFLLRDYIGKKPLFFANSNNESFIVSELKAIDFICNFQIVPKGFSELKKGKISLIEQHQIPFFSKEMLKQTIVKAVEKRIPKNEKQFGVFLSGGLDSSIIASIVSKYADNVIYYTLGNTDDMNFVNILAKAFGIENKIKNVELPTSNELSELIDKTVYHTESYNPSIISNGLATYLLSAEAHKDNLKVVLSGEGADELFCGYPVSTNLKEWFEKRTELIENMHFTELRRLDLSSMAHTIEIRCPFLDRKVYAVSNNCTAKDLISDFQGKQILRKAFKNDLPKEIIERNKMSFDVGSGIRKMAVGYLIQNGQTEKNQLQEIWNKYFPKSMSDIFYFHSYPTFDKAIEKRGVSHKNNELEKIEKLLLKEFETVPFHNLFMLNNKKIVASDLGGTCSDKAMHFKKVLSQNGISSELHSAFINGVECHRMLTVEIDNQKYFIDAGSGWASPKLFPAFEPIEYSVYGMTFKTELSNDNLFLFHKTNDNFKLMITIPLKTKPETEILSDIENRFSNNIIYPFQNSLRFSKVIDNSFYFIKGNILRIYNDNKREEKILNKTETETLLKDTFKFNLEGLDNWYTKLNITVIIATKNRPYLLKQRSLKSVVAQSLYPDCVVVVDDSDNQNSINENIAIVQEVKSQTEQITIEYIPNHRTAGVAGNWNSAIDFLLLQKYSPENTFIAILDDDDEWHSDYLKICSQSIVKKSLDMIACDFYRITDEEKIINTAPIELLTNDFLIGNPGIQGSTIFIRLSCFLEAGGFDENLKSCTDRDLCIRITDLGYIRYERLATPLMNHYAENDRIRMSTPNSESKNSGLKQFWLKHSKRMSIEQQDNYKKRAKTLFNWEFSEAVMENEVTNFSLMESKISYTLYVGIICSNYNIISCLIIQLGIAKKKFINRLRVFLLENNLSVEDKNKIVQSIDKVSLKVTFITPKMQNEWIAKGYFKNFARNKNNMFSIAQARTMLQKYIGQTMKRNAAVNAIAWILDEDMQITGSTLQGLKILSQLKQSGIDIVIGKYENSSPNPPINGIRIQLVDFWYNLCWLLNQKPNENLPDISGENFALIKKYPDYYYDLSRKHSGHLEHPFWIKPNSENETVGEAIERLCKNVVQIFGGTPLTRPLVTINSGHILDSVKDSVNRGGTTFIFNSNALTDTPNISMRINGTDVRRSDMIWAIVNKYYRKMNIKSANIPVWHAGKEISDVVVLDIDKLREEILGSTLYAALTDFLKTKPEHCLDFTEAEILEITQNFERLLKQRMVFLQQTFYRTIGISKSIKNLKIHKQNMNLQKLTKIINKVFNKKNFEVIEQDVNTISFSALFTFLNSMQTQSDNYKEINLL